MTDQTHTADVVIIGAGVIGCSTAYHLAAAGFHDVTVLEQGQVGSGSSSRSAAMLSLQFGRDPLIARMAQYSYARYMAFAEEVGVSPDFRRTGWIYIVGDEGVDALRRQVEMVQALGIATELLTPAEIGTHYPELYLEDIALGSWAPDDGSFDPHMIMWGYMKRARAAGVTLREGVRATDLVVEQGRVIAVETSAGRIATKCVIDAAGPWAAEVAGWAGVSLPLCNSARTIVVTNPVAEIPPDRPFVEELETEWYFRPEVDGVLMGMGLRAVDNPDVSLDETQMEMIIDRAVHRVPVLERASILTAWTGVRPLTPDDRPIIGPTAVGGLWLNSGWGGVGIIMAPLAGKLAAEYVQQGKTTTIDDSELRLDRFGSNGGG